MKKADYFALAEGWAKQAGVEQGLHSNFLMHKDRLWTTLSHFQLWTTSGKTILEIGAFFGYTPFLLHQNGNTVTVLEGDDPAVYPLKPLYANRGIKLVFADFGTTFGTPDLAKHRLPFPDNHFDLITCWETMEHFNFNPVGFVKELHRILKPGGIVTLTGPNRATLDHRVKMTLGRPIGEPVAGYFSFYNTYGGQFMGWHWREYTLAEFVELFATAHFHVDSAGYLTVFQNRERSGFSRKLKRLFNRTVCTLLPSCGTNCALTARK